MSNYEEFEEAFNLLPLWQQEQLYFSAKFQFISWGVIIVVFIVLMSTI